MCLLMTVSVLYTPWFIYHSRLLLLCERLVLSSIHIPILHRWKVRQSEWFPEVAELICMCNVLPNAPALDSYNIGFYEFFNFILLFIHCTHPSLRHRHIQG